ncbi:TetR/AcrR family transcriptional regulator [Actinoplanes sp. RD1]|uniref:TetR/AcrR family transcriptional regulator n=1 Tax=Actinoplanes sp. RD1 TaxID=3064538 RepID=UPI0027419BEF|nr:TetR/AcrR family transcriptional regulator [Actinoplanes sp. RD1]
MEHRGLRERKKQRTFDAVSTLAIDMFLERGYDNVSVSDIAAAAEISKPTLFRYFRSKEDLALHRLADYAGEPARIAAGAPDPLAALHRHFVDGLARRDPVTGLNDDPAVLAYHDLVFSTPSLSARVGDFQLRDEESLAEALAPAIPDPLAARLAAAQILAVQRVLARDNWRRLSAGESAAALHPAAAAAADRAFAQLRTGIS